jgi:hypothetical protein
MKKLLFAVPLVLFLAAACNKTATVSTTVPTAGQTKQTTTGTQNTSTSQQSSNTSNSQTSITATSHTPTIPSGWTTHEDYNLNFQISYPQNWNFEDDANFFPPGKNFDTTTGYVGDMVIDTQDNPNKEDLVTYYKNVDQSKGLFNLFTNSKSQTALTVNGFPAEKFSGVYGEVPADEYAVNLGQTIVELTIYSSHDSDGITSGMVNSISLPTSVTWTNYTNSQYHFQLQYPEVIPQHPVQVSTNSNNSNEIDFKYWDSGAYDGGFSIFVNPNPSNETLTQWFESNVDSNNILLNAGSYKLAAISGGQEYYLSGPIPSAYGNEAGPIFQNYYLMSNSKGSVFTLALPQDGSVDSQDFLGKVNSSFKFTQ